MFASSAPPTGDLVCNPACSLTGNRTRDPLVCRLALNPLGHISQGTAKLSEAQHFGTREWQRWNYCNQSFLDKAEYLPATPNWFSFPPWKRNRKELENIQGTEMIPKWGALFGGNLMQKNGELAGLGVSCLLSFINNSLGRLWNLWIFTLIYALAPLCKEFAVICGILSMIQTWWRPLTMTFGSVCGMYSHHNVKRNNFQSQVRG